MIHHLANLIHTVVNAIAPHHHHLTNAADAVGQHSAAVGHAAQHVSTAVDHVAQGHTGLSHAATGFATTSHTRSPQFGEKTAPASELIIARDGNGYKYPSQFVTGTEPYKPIPGQ